MNDTLPYIEAYFEKSLPEEERKIFEQRCLTDENFAGDVAFYITSREGLRQVLLEQKRQAWTEAETIAAATTIKQAPVKRMGVKAWLPYAVAASLVVAVLAYFLYPSSSPQQLADKYIQQNLTVISHTMDGATDSLQMGISAYNDGNYNDALLLFQKIATAHPNNADAEDYAGRSYLMKKDYDNAIDQFDRLAKRKLVSNYGPFLKAVSLLKRNKALDKADAKALLERVRDEKLEGSKEAADWLNNW